jgi:hypothetical protein
VRIEIPVDLYAKDLVSGRWMPKPHVKVWVPAYDVNEAGETIYRGPDLRKLVEERAEAKRREEARADKEREAARRFHS